MKYIFKRIALLIPVILGVTFISFALLYIAPGDPVQKKLQAQGTIVTEEVLENAREEMGLNKPFIIQYLNWLKDFLHGDLGNSYESGTPVSKKMLTAMGPTILLALSSMILTLVISIPAGIYLAIHKNRFCDYFIRLLTFIGNSIPNFLAALLLIYIFCLKFHLLPVLAQYSIKGLILPMVSLSIVMTSKFIRQIRAAVLEELGKEYVWGARTRGVREKVILYRNVLHNSMITIITLIGLSVGSLLAGTAIIETIFSWPGLGKMVIDAINIRDYPVIQGFVIWMAVVYVFINLLTDISYRILDPRVKEQKR
jgi:peptide/nickel transport system permease protein